MNPLFVRLTHQKTYIKNSFYLLLLATLILGSLALIIEGGTFQFIVSGPPDFLTLMVGWLLMTLMPVSIAIFGSFLTATDARTNSYQLMSITPISELNVLKGYVYSAIYRARIAFLLVIFLMPMLLGALVRGNLLARIDCTGNSDFYQVCPNAVPLTTSEWVGWLIAAIQLAIALLGLNLLSATVGVAIGLATRNRWLSIFISFGISLTSVLCFLNLLFYSFNNDLIDLNSLTYLLAFKAILPITTLNMVLPYVLILVVM